MSNVVTKPAIASTTVWGAIIAGISAALAVAGVQVEGLEDPNLPLELSTLFGAALALYGRLRANTLISGLFSAK